MVIIVVNAFKNFSNEVAAELFAFAVNVGVAASREIDPFKGATFVFTWLDDRGNFNLSGLVDYYSLARCEFLDFIKRGGEDGLDNRTFGGHDRYLVVDVVEGRSDSMGIAYNEHVARTRRTTHGEATVPRRNGSLQNSAQVDVVLDCRGQGRVAESVAELAVESVVLFVESIAELFENHDGVAV